MRLASWARAFRDVEFDAETGTARVVRLPEARPDTAPVRGFATSERSLSGLRHWFAIYRSGDTIVFQTGRRRWLAADPSVAYRHSRRLPFVSSFEVLAEGRPVFSIRYPHVGRLLMALIDPTYDGIDQDSDFMLEFLAEHVGSESWRDHVLEQWTDADAVVPRLTRQEPR